MADLFDAAAAREARDAGMTLVLDHEEEDWKDRARALVRLVPPGWVGLSEDMRFLLTGWGLEEPHSPNVWGALTHWALRAHLLEPTGIIRNTRDRPSHASYTKEYRRTEAV